MKPHARPARHPIVRASRRLRPRRIWHCRSRMQFVAARPTQRRRRDAAAPLLPPPPPSPPHPIRTSTPSHPATSQPSPTTHIPRLPATQPPRAFAPSRPPAAPRALPPPSDASNAFAVDQVAEITFNFWYVLSEELAGSGRMLSELQRAECKRVFTPFFLNLGE